MRMRLAVRDHRQARYAVSSVPSNSTPSFSSRVCAAPQARNSAAVRSAIPGGQEAKNCTADPLVESGQGPFDKKGVTFAGYRLALAIQRHQRPVHLRTPIAKYAPRRAIRADRVEIEGRSDDRVTSARCLRDNRARVIGDEGRAVISD